MEEGKRQHLEKPHAVCLPMPAQGHIDPMMVFATFLHSKGFTITFVHTDFDRHRILRSSPDALKGYKDFHFASFPDGLPPSDFAGNRHIPSLCDSLHRTGFGPFRELLGRINEEGPRVTLVVWDGITSFGRRAAAELGVPDVMFWTASASGLVSYLHFPELVERGIFPLPDEAYLNDGYLDTSVDWIPGMKNITVKDLPALLRTTDPRDIMFNFVMEETRSTYKASSIILNTFDDLEKDVLSAMTPMLPKLYTIGPLSLLPNNTSAPMPSNLWKEDTAKCIEWLNQRNPRSVVYVNFGSIINLQLEQFREFASGLVSSDQYIMWVIRPDLVTHCELARESANWTEDKHLIVEWCSQTQVLLHPSVGVFLTHCGWNSILESICGGVPMVCWPLFAEQTTNCYLACKELGVGVEISCEVKREEVENAVREVMEGTKGKEMKNKAKEWKEKAEKAVGNGGGSSYSNINLLLDELLMVSKI